MSTVENEAAREIAALADRWVEAMDAYEAAKAAMEEAQREASRRGSVLTGHALALREALQRGGYVEHKAYRRGRLAVWAEYGAANVRWVEIDES